MLPTKTNMIHLSTWDITMKQWCPTCYKITLQLSNCIWNIYSIKVRQDLHLAPTAFNRLLMPACHPTRGKHVSRRI